jgi:hypothetical protein
VTAPPRLAWLLLAAALALPARGDGADWSFGPASGDFAASIRAEKREFTGAEPVLVWLRVKNVAGESRTVLLCGVWPNHRLVTTDASGAELPLTEAGRRARAAFGAEARRKNVPLELGAGEAAPPEGPYDLREHFALPRSGAIRVSFVYRDGAASARSNELRLELR